MDDSTVTPIVPPVTPAVPPATPAAPPVTPVPPGTPVVPPDPPAHLIGLPQWARTTIVFLSIFLAATSLYLSWSLAPAIGKEIGFAAGDVAPLRQIAYGSTGTLNNLQEDNGTKILVHLANNQAQMKMITNHQSIALLSIGVSVAMLSIGYALFLIGADGAFKLSYRHPDQSRFMLYGTAPGLLCFVLATALMAVGMTRRSNLTTSNFDLGQRPSDFYTQPRSQTQAGTQVASQVKTGTVDQTRYLDMGGLSKAEKQSLADAVSGWLKKKQQNPAVPSGIKESGSR